MFGAQENNVFYYLGCAYDLLGDETQAQAWFERASTGLSDPTSAQYYNDQPPDMIFYQGLALQKRGLAAEAGQLFQKLVDYGLAHMDDKVVVDYFAVSLPDFLVFDVDLAAQNRLHCHYMLGLGYFGLGQATKAREQLNAVLEMDANHLGAVIHTQML